MQSMPLVDLYRTMMRIRQFELTVERVSQGGVAAFGGLVQGEAHVRGPLHLSIGQEAVAAGVCAHMQDGDYVTSNHRGHGHTLAMGASVERMMLEFFGKAGGYCGGKGGSMHIADFSHGMLGANGVVAAGLPIAVGAAHSIKRLGTAAVSVCFFGDGAINRGPFLESLNWAQVYRLPVLFVCEDNQWAATTPTASTTAGAGVVARAQALGLPAVSVDGNDVQAVYAAAQLAIQTMREDGLPSLLHARTYRLRGHVSVDKAAYRDPQAVQHAQERDPLPRTRQTLLQLGTPAADLDAIEAQAQTACEAAVQQALQAPWPQASAAFTDVQNVGAGQWH